MLIHQLLDADFAITFLSVVLFMQLYYEIPFHKTKEGRAVFIVIYLVS